MKSAESESESTERVDKSSKMATSKQTDLQEKFARSASQQENWKFEMQLQSIQEEQEQWRDKIARTQYCMGKLDLYYKEKANKIQKELDNWQRRYDEKMREAPKLLEARGIELRELKKNNRLMELELRNNQLILERHYERLNAPTPVEEVVVKKNTKKKGKKKQ